MKNLLTIVFSFLFGFHVFSQTIVLERVSELMPQGYTIEGTAFLEEFSDGSLQLRLSDDFSTPPGPDVRILLGNSLSLTGAEEIVNLSDIGHFSGELTVDVPSNIGINDFDFILFYCVLFQQFWASGEFGDAMAPGGGGGGGPTCEESTVNNANGSNTIDICPIDNISNFVSFENSLDLDAGDNYAYLITDQNEVLQEVVFADGYDFEGSSLSTQRVYGLHYSGTLNTAIGSNRFVTTASDCFEHSSTSNNSFITITKNDCFDCQFTAVSNANGSNIVDICPSDDISDVINFDNSLNTAAGSNYAYLITDQNEVLQEVVFDDQFDFEGSNLSTQRVYGIHFDGTLDANIGSDRLSTTASICHEHSSNTAFITVLKDACINCEDSDVFTQNGISTINICPSDDINDIVDFDNNLGINAGNAYAYLITDQNEILQEVVLSDSYNFEGSSDQEQRVYGIRYDGFLNSVLGQDRMLTTATECHTHSSSTDFITINKEACAVFDCLASTTSSTSSSSEIDICPTDGEDDIIGFENSINVPAGVNYAYIITNENQVVSAVVQEPEYNFEGTSLDEQRVYGIHFNGVLNPVIGANRMQTTATDCFEHSDNSDFLTITKDACPDPFECMENATATTDWMTLVDVCPNDGVDDIVELRNNLFVAPGENYAYLITNANEVVQAVTTDSLFNFEGSTATEQRVYGIHFEGSLNVMIGLDRMQTTATGCFTHSSSDLFLTVTKDACEDPFECMESLTATTDWATSVDICPTDGVEDLIELRNNLFIAPGENYAYLITDADGILQEVTTDSLYNFEGSSVDEQRVYGIHYDGTLMAEIGQDRMQTTATGCFVHSGDNLFLTINKEACPDPFECMESLTATTNWATNVDICPNDGIDDIIELRNNLFIAPGDNYAYLITDAEGILQEVTTDSLYNFEGTASLEQRVYGIHYSGILVPEIGEDRLLTEATGCFTHSGDNLFLTITKSGCTVPFECQESLTASTNWEVNIDICATDGEVDLIELQNNINVPTGHHYAFLLTDEFENLQAVLLDTFYDFENTGVEEQRVYGISFDGQLEPKIGENRKNTTATKCFIHSGDDLFITINKTASCTTATEEEIRLKDEINIFPNPSQGQVNLAYDSAAIEIIDLRVININGQQVGHERLGDVLQISDAGVYLINIVTKEASISKKVVIQ